MDESKATNESGEALQLSIEQLLLMEIIRLGQRFLGNATANVVSGSVLDEAPEIKSSLISLLRSQNRCPFLFLLYYYFNFT